MAAGEGRRLRPVTERFAKPVLPIDGRPVISTLLREIESAGIREVTVVTGHLAHQVERLLGDGSAFGLELRYVRQPRPEGSADAVVRALEAGTEPPVLLTAADTVYTPGTVATFAEGFRRSGAAGAIAGRRGPTPTPGKPGLVIVEGRVTRVYDLDPALALTSGPLWALGQSLPPFLADLPGPPFELRVAYQRAIDAGFEVAGLEIGPTRDLTTPLDLILENVPYLRALR